MFREVKRALFSAVSYGVTGKFPSAVCGCCSASSAKTCTTPFIILFCRVPRFIFALVFCSVTSLCRLYSFTVSHFFPIFKPPLRQRSPMPRGNLQKIDFFPILAGKPPPGGGPPPQYLPPLPGLPLRQEGRFPAFCRGFVFSLSFHLPPIERVCMRAYLPSILPDNSLFPCCFRFLRLPLPLFQVNFGAKNTAPLSLAKADLCIVYCIRRPKQSLCSCTCYSQQKT